MSRALLDQLMEEMKNELFEKLVEKMRKEMTATLRDTKVMEEMKSSLLQSCYSKMEVMVQNEVKRQLEASDAVDELMSGHKFDMLAKMRKVSC